MDGTSFLFWRVWCFCNGSNQRHCTLSSVCFVHRPGSWCQQSCHWHVYIVSYLGEVHVVPNRANSMPISTAFRQLILACRDCHKWWTTLGVEHEFSGSFLPCCALASVTTWIGRILDLRYAACISYHPFVYRLGQSTGPINLRLGRNRNYLVQIQNRFLNKCKITKKFKPVVPSIRPWPWPTMLNVPSESTRKL